MEDGVIWLALVVFHNPDACYDYVVEHKLMEQLDWQCILIEDESLAPAYSLRPKARRD
jgi:hypothetical protein